MAMCRRNLYHYDLRVCTELQVLSKTASRLWFYAYKKYKNGNSARRTASLRLVSGFTLTKSTRTVTLQDVQPHNVTSGRPYVTAEVTILIQEYPENYQK